LLNSIVNSLAGFDGRLHNSWSIIVQIEQADESTLNAPEDSTIIYMFTRKWWWKHTGNCVLQCQVMNCKYSRIHYWNY
jgi:hypothetical protein